MALSTKRSLPSPMPHPAPNPGRRSALTTHPASFFEKLTGQRNYSIDSAYKADIIHTVQSVSMTYRQVCSTDTNREKDMAKINQSPKQPAAMRRKQLLTSAQQLFIEKGYRGTSIEEIAQKAKLSKGAFYHHFENKEAVLHALVTEMGCNYDDSFQILFRKGNITPMDLLRALLDAHKTDDLVEFNTMIDLWVQARRIPSIVDSLEEEHRAIMTEVVKHMDRSYGRTTAARAKIAQFTLLFYNGLAARKATKPDAVDVNEQLAVFADCIKAWKNCR